MKPFCSLLTAIHTTTKLSIGITLYGQIICCCRGAVALVALLATRKLSMTLLFENHQTCATFELIDKVLHFLGQLWI